jgi:hypothetical protein
MQYVTEQCHLCFVHVGRLNPVVDIALEWKLIGIIRDKEVDLYRGYERFIPVCKQADMPELKIQTREFGIFC